MAEAPEALPKLASRIAGCVCRTALEAVQPATKFSPSVHFAMAASHEALSQADWFPTSKKLLERTGVSIGVGMSDPAEFYTSSGHVMAGVSRRISPYFIPRVLPNMASGVVSIEHGFRGPNHAVSTACASGAHAVGDAFRMISYDEADVMVAGGSESCIDVLSIAGFSRMRALATAFNDDPTKASRPFDKNRSGFVISEGAGILVLEEMAHAKARGAPVLCEIVGYGRSGDAFHVTQPSSEGVGAVLAMERALQDAGMRADEVGYLNAHATSTPLGDEIELDAISRVFGRGGDTGPWVSSTKGSVGHLLGAAGAVEAAFTVLALSSGRLPPTLNLEEPDSEGATNLIGPEGREGASVRAALTNSFGFGGTNCSLAFACA